MLLAFNSFLVAMLSVPVVTLMSRRWTKARALPAALLMGSLVVGTAVAAMGFWRGQRFTVDISQVASFSFALSVDRLSAFFLLLICSVVPARRPVFELLHPAPLCRSTPALAVGALASVPAVDGSGRNRFHARLRFCSDGN